MAMDFDSQLIESVEVRRNRLTASLLYGANPTERRWKDRAKLLVFGVVAAAVICALCVAISFVVQILTNWIAQRDERERQQQEQQLEREKLEQERRQQEELRQKEQPQGDALRDQLPHAVLAASLARPTDLPDPSSLPISAAEPSGADSLERC